MSYFRSVALGAAMTLAGVAGAAAQEVQERTMTLGHVVAEQFPYHTSAMFMKETMAEETDGKWTLEVHPSGAMGGERDALDALLLGTMDFTWVHTAAMASFVPSFELFNMPFVFHSPEHIEEALSTLDFSKFYEEADAAGFKLIGIGSPAFRYPMNNIRPIETAADFEDIKMRTMGVSAHIDTYEALGSQVASTSFAELYGALQTGTVDGNENALSALNAMRFNEVQEYLTLLPTVANIAVLVMSKSTYDAMSAEEQALVDEIGKQTVEKNNSDYASMDAEALEAMKQEGLKVNEIDDLSSFVEATAPVREKYSQDLEPWVRDLMAEIQELPSAK